MIRSLDVATVADPVASLVSPAVGDDRASEQQGFRRPVPAQRLRHHIDQQVLQLQPKLVSGYEGLAIPHGQLVISETATWRSTLASAGGEGVLQIVVGQAAGIHLVDEQLERLARQFRARQTGSRQLRRHGLASAEQSVSYSGCRAHQCSTDMNCTTIASFPAQECGRRMAVDIGRVGRESCAPTAP
jgi:hypothetical protein